MNHYAVENFRFKYTEKKVTKQKNTHFSKNIHIDNESIYTKHRIEVIIKRPKKKTRFTKKPHKLKKHTPKNCIFKNEKKTQFSTAQKPKTIPKCQSFPARCRFPRAAPPSRGALSRPFARQGAFPAGKFETACTHTYPGGDFGSFPACQVQQAADVDAGHLGGQNGATGSKRRFVVNFICTPITVKEQDEKERRRRGGDNEVEEVDGRFGADDGQGIESRRVL